MAVNNFIQAVWSKNILDSLEKKCKLVRSCLTQYEGDCKRAGSVKILGVGDPTVRKYTGESITVDQMSDEGQDLHIDQANYFAFLVDDVDKAQSVPGLAEEYQRRSVHKLAVERDAYVAGLIAGATHETVAEDITQEAVKKAVDDAISELRLRDFDEEGVIELSVKACSAFKNCLITLSTDNPEYIEKGIIGMYDGFEVVMSNNLVHDEEGDHCCVRSKKAIAFAGQINEVEAFRSQDYFADEVRGLDTFGAKIIDEDRIQQIIIPFGVAA